MPLFIFIRSHQADPASSSPLQTGVEHDHSACALIVSDTQPSCASLSHIAQRSTHQWSQQCTAQCEILRRTVLPFFIFIRSHQADPASSSPLQTGVEHDHSACALIVSDTQPSCASLSHIAQRSTHQWSQQCTAQCEILRRTVLPLFSVCSHRHQLYKTSAHSSCVHILSQESFIRSWAPIHVVTH